MVQQQQQIEMVQQHQVVQSICTIHLVLITSKTPIMTNWVDIGALCSMPSPTIISVPQFWPRKIKSVSTAVLVKRYCSQQSIDKHIRVFGEANCFEDLFLSREMSSFFGFQCNCCLLIAAQLWLVLAFLPLSCFNLNLLWSCILMSYQCNLAL